MRWARLERVLRPARLPRPRSCSLKCSAAGVRADQACAAEADSLLSILTDGAEGDRRGESGRLLAETVVVSAASVAPPVIPAQTQAAQGSPALIRLAADPGRKGIEGNFGGRVPSAAWRTHSSFTTIVS
jgi:hypothetical protein